MNMNANIKNAIKQYFMRYHSSPGRWLVIIFFVTNEALLSIVDYYGTFQIAKRPNSLTADNLVKAAKIVFAKFGLPQENNFQCRHYFHISDVQKTLQTDEH